MLTERDFESGQYELDCPPATKRIGGEGSSLGRDAQGSPPSDPAPSPAGTSKSVDFADSGPGPSQTDARKPRKRGGRKRGPRKQVQPQLRDPALNVRTDAPAFDYRTDDEHLLSGIKASRGSSRPGGNHRALDSHLPTFWRLGSAEWAEADALPDDWLTGEWDESIDWDAFLGRMLPSFDKAPASIHNEDCQDYFNSTAPQAVMLEALRALGWPVFPSRRKLKKHMLGRVEREYAQHLIEHGYTPGQWCRECKCRCAPAVDAIVASMAEPAVNSSSDESDEPDNDDDAMPDVDPLPDGSADDF
jgi:hypothetical protein